MVRSVVKSAVWERVDAGLRVVYDVRSRLVIDDPDGTVEALLASGGGTVAGLADALGVPVEDVVAAIGLFDGYGLVEDGDPLQALAEQVRERNFSNLVFFESFAGHSRGRYPMRASTGWPGSTWDTP